ncbi:MAG: hypothetical protein WCP70_04145 [Methanothrix sp.]
MEENQSISSDGKTELESEPELKSESVPGLEQELESELEPLDVHLVSNQLLDSNDYINIYKVNRNHIREQSKAVIPACGVLLTGVFGLLYFIFNGNGDKIQIDPYIIGVIVLAAIVLVTSIASNIKSVQAASPLGELPETRDQQWDFIYDIYNEEYKWGNRSILLLGFALILLVIIILYFAYSYLSGTPSANNVQVAQRPNIFIIPLPRLF